jgi:hypothetical protein
MTEPIIWSNEIRKLGDLNPWQRNPRKINEIQTSRLQESFDTFGQVELIAIGPNNEVYNGHQRLKVLLQEYGPDYEVAVRVASRTLTEKERQKLTVLLHKGATGEWDFGILDSEFEMVDLVEWGFDESELTAAIADLPKPPNALDLEAETQAEKPSEGDLYQCPKCGFKFRAG